MFSFFGFLWGTLKILFLVIIGVVTIVMINDDYYYNRFVEEHKNLSRLSTLLFLSFFISIWVIFEHTSVGFFKSILLSLTPISIWLIFVHFKNKNPENKKFVERFEKRKRLLQQKENQEKSEKLKREQKTIITPLIQFLNEINELKFKSYDIEKFHEKIITHELNLDKKEQLHNMVKIYNVLNELNSKVTVTFNEFTNYWKNGQEIRNIIYGFSTETKEHDSDGKVIIKDKKWLNSEFKDYKFVVDELKKQLLEDLEVLNKFGNLSELFIDSFLNNQKTKFYEYFEVLDGLGVFYNDYEKSSIKSLNEIRFGLKEISYELINTNNLLYTIDYKISQGNEILRSIDNNFNTNNDHLKSVDKKLKSVDKGLNQLNSLTQNQTKEIKKGKGLSN